MKNETRGAIELYLKKLEEKRQLKIRVESCNTEMGKISKGIYAQDAAEQFVFSSKAGKVYIIEVDFEEGGITRCCEVDIF